MKRVVVLLLSSALSFVAIAPAQAATKTRLTIKADLADGGGVRSWSLICDTKAGNHPNREAACDLLKKAGFSLFKPVPNNVPCTMIYGGDQKVSVTGVVKNKKVSATFNRSNGCEISRYERALPLFTIPDTQVFSGTVTLDGNQVASAVVFTNGKTTATTRSDLSGFRIRLSTGTWTGSAGSGITCTPAVISVPAPDVPLVISCSSAKP